MNFNASHEERGQEHYGADTGAGLADSRGDVSVRAKLPSFLKTFVGIMEIAVDQEGFFPFRI